MLSHLHIRNYPQERATVSGGTPLQPMWRPSAQCRSCTAQCSCFEAELPELAQLPGLRLDGVREIRARYPNFDPELDSVIDGELRVHDGGRTGNG